MIEGLEERTKARDEREVKGRGEGVKMRQARRTFREMKQEGWAMILPTVRVSSFSY